MSEQVWMERAQSAEAKLTTAQAALDPLKEKVRAVKEALGVREKSDGSFEVDYEAFVGNLGPEGALEVRGIIDEMYGISGAAGEKPKMRVPAAA